MLKEVEKLVEEEKLPEIYLHVQVNNDVALRFYLKHGFDNVQRVENYYQNVQPSDCFILRKVFQHETETTNDS